MGDPLEEELSGLEQQKRDRLAEVRARVQSDEITADEAAAILDQQDAPANKRILEILRERRKQG